MAAAGNAFDRYRLALAAREVDLISTEAGTHRASARFGSVVAVDLGVAQPWGVRVGCWTDDVSPADVAHALAWARARARGRGFRLTAPRVDGPWEGEGLVVRDRLPALAMPASKVADIRREVPAGVTVRAPHDLDEIVVAYGGWMDDVELAGRLVTQEDLLHPQRGFLVADAGGRVVGCALVWWAAGTAYVSGLGVVARERERGYGRALTVAAARLGAAGPAGRPAPDLVWMYGTPAGAALYGALGFEPAGEEVQLGAADGP